MATYLDLVNKVIEESGSEKDLLTSITWSTADAGKRIYPRVKRNVADAWKLIQMSRNEWQFNTGILSTIIYPRVKISEGFRAAGTPPVGSVFIGTDSLFTMTIRAVYTTGDWTLGEAVGQIEFDTYDGNQLRTGETFTEVTPVLADGIFTYLGKGSYDFLEVDPDVREIQWASFTSYSIDDITNPSSTSASIPVMYIPWDNWFYNEYAFTTSSQSTPSYVSQDFEGNTVFYPQTLNPFRVTFIYESAPQILTLFDDEVRRLPEEYHDWIAWQALIFFALYDKNTILLAYASKNETFYRNRAERNLMPLISYQASCFNV